MLVIERVDTCPLCNNGIDVRILYAYLNDETMLAEILFQCPKSDCHHVFLGFYSAKLPTNRKILLTSAPPYVIYKLDGLAPIKFHPREFSTEITSISNNFVRIYNQSKQAEDLMLNEIAGPGYRKSLEFLIKDFAILKNAAKEKEIKVHALSEVINNYVDDQRIQNMAKRASWIGNDEAHYERRWEDKDITDLKRLIELTVKWIESVQMTEDYMEDMQ